MKKLICILISALMLLALASCDNAGNADGSTDSENLEISGENTEDEVTETVEAKNTDYEARFVNCEEENCLTWEVAEDTYRKVFHDGTNVTGCETWVYCESDEDAAILAESMQAFIGIDESMENVYSQGRYVVYVFNDKGYTISTYVGAKAAYDKAVSEETAE